MNDTNKQKQRTVRCSDEVWEAIKVASERDDISVSDFVIKAALAAVQNDTSSQQFILTPKTQDTLVRGMFALVIAKRLEFKNEEREDFWQAILKQAQILFDEDQSSASSLSISTNEDSENR